MALVDTELLRKVFTTIPLNSRGEPCKYPLISFKLGKLWIVRVDDIQLENTCQMMSAMLKQEALAKFIALFYRIYNKKCCKFLQYFLDILTITNKIAVLVSASNSFLGQVFNWGLNCT